MCKVTSTRFVQILFKVAKNYTQSLYNRNFLLKIICVALLLI